MNLSHFYLIQCKILSTYLIKIKNWNSNWKKKKKKCEELKLKLKEKDEKIKELENQLKYGKKNKDNEKGDEKNSKIKKDN